ncbi:hypothetical protein VNO77_34502 [Canavalia gladiata]|uniref:Uncharacterized protein n=1 Tax=Canavalia gladiata TaxID=3824 RepID=A0AAN9PXA3_CANGL
MGRPHRRAKAASVEDGPDSFSSSGLHSFAFSSEFVLTWPSLMLPGFLSRALLLHKINVPLIHIGICVLVWRSVARIVAVEDPIDEDDRGPYMVGAEFQSYADKNESLIRRDLLSLS